MWHDCKYYLTKEDYKWVILIEEYGAQGEQRKQAANSLNKHPYFRQCHPTAEVI